MEKLSLTQEDYRAYPALSTSDIKQALDNPYKFRIGFKTEETPAMKLGSLVHTLVLEPSEFNKTYAIAPIADKRTKEGKAIWAEFSEANQDKIIVDSAMYETAKGMLHSLKTSGVFERYFTQGEAETSYIGEAFGAKIKVRPDFFNLEKNLIVDLKCVSNASAKGFQRLCANLRYYIQAYLYMRITGAKQFVFVAIETKEPYTIGIYELDYIALELAEAEVKKALQIISDMDELDNIINVYGSQSIEPVMLALPNYVFYDSEA